MLVFDVKCQVRVPIEMTDTSGRKIKLDQGSYRLRGIGHFVRTAASGEDVTGTDISFLSKDGRRVICTVSGENLAHLISTDEVEFTIR